MIKPDEILIKAMRKVNVPFFIYIVLSILILCLAIESLSYFVLTYKDTLSKNIGLERKIISPTAWLTYEDYDRVGGWTLLKGYKKTGAEVIQDEGDNKYEVNRVRELLKTLDIQKNDIAFQINSDGYRGLELSRKKNITRILIIGDSVTFGGNIDALTYPRILENIFTKYGCNIEVINASIPGLGIRHNLRRVDEFLDLNSHITLIMLGASDLFSPASAGVGDYSSAGFSYSIGLIKHLMRRFITNKPLNAGSIIARGDQVQDVLHDPLLLRLDDHVPPAAADTARLAQIFRASNTKIVVATIPTVFSSWIPPDQKIFETIHLPIYSNNPLVYTKIVERYNVALRAHAQRGEFDLVDVEQMFLDAPEPKHSYFFDSIHLRPTGHLIIAQYLAEQMRMLFTCEAYE